jgi:hypothetical protein
VWYSIAAKLDGVRDHVVVAATAVLDVSVGTHVDGPRRFLLVYGGGFMVARYDTRVCGRDYDWRQYLISVLLHVAKDWYAYLHFA